MKYRKAAFILVMVAAAFVMHYYLSSRDASRMIAARATAQREFAKLNFLDTNVKIEGSYWTGFSCFANKSDIGEFRADGETPKRACESAVDMVVWRFKEHLPENSRQVYENWLNAHAKEQ